MITYCPNAPNATVTLISSNQKVVTTNCPVGIELKNINLEECLLYKVKAYVITQHIEFGKPCPGNSIASQTVYYEGEVRGRATMISMIGCEGLKGGYSAASIRDSTLGFNGKATDCVTDVIYYIPAVSFDPDPTVSSDITNNSNHYTSEAQITSVEVIEGIRKNRITEIKIYDSVNVQGVKTTYPVREIFRGTINNPNDFTVACGDDCPPGTTKCFSTNYPGYCCLPCNEVKNEIRAIASQVRSINNG